MVLALAAFLATVTVTPDLQVAELRPGLWIHTSWSEYQGARVPSNGLIVREGKTAVVVDTAWGEAPTEALLDWIERSAKLKVARVVATHGHADRVGGAPVLQRRGIPLDRITDLAPGASKRLGSLEVFHPGAAHTRDNVVVWHAGQRVLFGGCAVKSASSTDMGNVADADLASWPDAMRRTLDRYPTAVVVVPGHGAHGGLDLLRHTLTLLAAPRPAP